MSVLDQIGSKCQIGDIIYNLKGHGTMARIFCYKVTKLPYISKNTFDTYILAVRLGKDNLKPVNESVYTQDILTFEEAKSKLILEIRRVFEDALAIRPYDESLNIMPRSVRKDLVLVESPFAPITGHDAIGMSHEEYLEAIADNIAFAKQAIQDCLNRGESPYATHLFFPQPGMLNDRDAEQRKLGIEAGLDWGSRADRSVVYIDRGISKGMLEGIKRAKNEGRTIVYRILANGKEFANLSDAEYSLKTQN